MLRPFVFLFLALFSLSSISSREASEGLKGFSVDLIHRDSPLSPFYNPSLTPSERIINTVLRSNSGLKRVSHFLDENKLPQSLVIPDSAQYLMKFYIGTPPVERLAMVDVGSSLIWVQTSPCVSCFPQDTPLFEPLKSSTFKVVTCDSQPCTLLAPGQRHCENLGDPCGYITTYGDKSLSAGIIGTETLSFDSSGGVQTVSFPNSIFGCGRYNQFTFYKSNKLNGIMGLGAGPLSLVSQLGSQVGHKFSYCLVPYNSTSNSKLKFGSEATITTDGVVSTPLIINPSFPSYYFLNLEAVTIGQKVVPTGQTGGNIVIDSGTPLTYLEDTFYNSFTASLKETLGNELVQDLGFPFNFCFQETVTSAIPDIAFQFTGARVALRTKNLFISVPDTNMVCLAVASSSRIGISIYGSIAQYDFQVEHDLAGKKVSFAPSDCATV